MQYLMGRYTVSARRACLVVRATRSSVYYRSRKDPLTALRQRMRELAQTRVRFGYRRLRVLLQREGWTVGKERFCRVIPRKAWRCGGNVRGGTRLRCIASSGDQRPRGTISGAWTSSRINWPTVGDFEHSR